jgi:hypothetical protein
MVGDENRNIVIVTGDRDYDDAWICAVILTGFRFYHGVNNHLYVGRAPGADSIAEEEAKAMNGWEVHPFPAEWNKHGKAAGPLRNRKMIDAALAWRRSEDDTLVMFAFHDDLDGKSKGTKDAVRYAASKEIPVYLIERR